MTRFITEILGCAAKRKLRPDHANGEPDLRVARGCGLVDRLRSSIVQVAGRSTNAAFRVTWRRARAPLTRATGADFVSFETMVSLVQKLF